MNEATGGQILFKGQDITCFRGKDVRDLRTKMAMIFQHFNLVPRRSVLGNVLMGALSRTSDFKSLFGMFSKADIAKASQYLQLVGIADKTYIRASQLSGGQQQRVAIARVLIQDPEVILADEPVSSVDPTLAAIIVKLLLEISEKTRKTLLVNLHSIDLALAHFTRIIGIKKGRTVFDLSPDKISSGLLEDLYSGHLPQNQHEKVPDEEPGALVYQ